MAGGLGCGGAIEDLQPAVQLRHRRYHLRRHLGAARDQGGGQAALTLRGQSNQPYLLELHTRCSGLTTASSIAVSHSFGTVMPRMDSVQPLAAGGRPSTFSSCNIATARRINQGAVNEARRDLKEAQREATPVERDPNAKADDAPN